MQNERQMPDEQGGGRRLPPVETRFQKGKSGNPAGRKPIGKSIPDLLRWAGDQKTPEQLAAKMRSVYNLPPTMPLTVEQTTALVVYANALKGSIQHIQFIADRTEGKVKDVLAVQSGDSMTVVEEIITVRKKP